MSARIPQLPPPPMPAAATFHLGRPVRPEQPAALTGGALHHAYVRCQPLFTHVVQHPIAAPLSSSPLGAEPLHRIYLRHHVPLDVSLGFAVRYQAARAKGSPSEATIRARLTLGGGNLIAGPELLNAQEHDATEFSVRWVILPGAFSLGAEPDEFEDCAVWGEDVRVHSVTLFGIPPREVD